MARRTPMKDPKRFVRRCGAKAQAFREDLLARLGEFDAEDLSSAVHDRAVALLDRLHPLFRALASQPSRLDELATALWLDVDDEGRLVVEIERTTRPPARLSLRIDASPHVHVALDGSTSRSSALVTDGLKMHTEGTFRDLALPRTERRGHGHAGLGAWFDGLDPLVEEALSRYAAGALVTETVNPLLMGVLEQAGALATDEN